MKGAKNIKKVIYETLWQGFYKITSFRLFAYICAYII